MKKLLKILLKTISGFVVFVMFYLLMAFGLSSITVNKNVANSNDVTIYIRTNGVHTDIVVPVKSAQYDWSKQVKFSNTLSKDTSFQYLAMGWGDKGFYLETPEWKDLKASVAFKAAFGLSTTAIHATYYPTITESESCRKIQISHAQYRQLVDYITGSFQKDKQGYFIPVSTNAVYGNNDAFYEANGSYSMLHTCNSWANSGLRASGQKCCLWTAFDKPIFAKYKQ